MPEALGSDKYFKVVPLNQMASAGSNRWSLPSTEVSFKACLSIAIGLGPSEAIAAAELHLANRLLKEEEEKKGPFANTGTS